MATLAKFPGRAETKEMAGAELGWDAATLRRYWVGGSVVPQTNLLRIEVQGPDAEGAARLATAAADATRHEADRVYRVVTSSFLARGGDGLEGFTAGTNRTDHGILLRDALIRKAERDGGLRADETNRILFDR